MNLWIILISIFHFLLCKNLKFWKIPWFKTMLKNLKQKMKKMMTGRKISTSEDVYSHSTHTQILHAIPHSHSFAFVCKPTFFLPECNKAGLLFASGCNSWYFDIVQQSFLIYILKYILNFQFIIELKDKILDRIHV